MMFGSQVAKGQLRTSKPSYKCQSGQWTPLDRMESEISHRFILRKLFFY